MKKCKQALIFGTGSIAEVAMYYLERDSIYSIAAFISDDGVDSFCDRDVIRTDVVTKKYPPKDYDAFVAIGYSAMNKNRKKCMNFMMDRGYRLLNYVSSDAHIYTDLELNRKSNLFILENNVIQPFVKIGNGVYLWSGNHIGHHSVIKDYSFVSSHVVISGHCTIGECSFLGVNSTISEGVSIGDENIIGAGAYIKKNTENGSVYHMPMASKSSKNSNFFMK